MTTKQSEVIFEKIKAGFKEAIAELYQDAYENGTELVISKKAGEVEHIKVVSINPLKYIKVR